MTIYKHLQTDGSGNRFLHLFAKLFRIPCKSRVVSPSSYASPYNLHCTLRRYHGGKHYDANAAMRWCYGDEFTE